MSLLQREPMFNSLVILGASGFVGQAIIAQVPPNYSIKAVARSVPLDASPKATWYAADLLLRESLVQILKPGDTVINMAFMSMENVADNSSMITNIIDACLQCGVKQLIHFSTATVIGVAKETIVDETTVCKPVTKYDQIKLSIEQQLLAYASDSFDVVILRPTAIVGSNGKNLLKLANSIVKGNPFINYIRASLFGRRKMHLVSVRNVASAALHLVARHEVSRGSIYFISSDDDPENNFLSVENMLRKALGFRERKWPVLPLPLICLSLLLKLKRQSASNVVRIHDSQKIQETNFVPVDSISSAVNDFACSFLKKPML